MGSYLIILVITVIALFTAVAGQTIEDKLKDGNAPQYDTTRDQATGALSKYHYALGQGGRPNLEGEVQGVYMYVFARKDPNGRIFAQLGNGINKDEDSFPDISFNAGYVNGIFNYDSTKNLSPEDMTVVLKRADEVVEAECDQWEGPTKANITYAVRVADEFYRKDPIDTMATYYAGILYLLVNSKE